jgi:hypothetical protein
MMKKKKTIFNFIVDNNYFVSFMTVLTLIALFSNDIQMASLPSDVDLSLDIIQTIMLCYLVWKSFHSCGKEELYQYSFLLADIISTISMIQDISFKFNHLLNIAYR